MRQTSHILRWLVPFIAISSLFLYLAPREHDSSYAVDSPVRVCPSGEHCIYNYNVEVANVGRKDQPSVTLTIERSFFDQLILPPRARDHGISERQIGLEMLDSYVLLTLKDIPPKKRVEITFSAQLPKQVSPPQDPIIRAHAEVGRMRYGSGALILIGRVLFSFFGWLF